MRHLIRRNLLLYFRNLSHVLLSLLGAIISFGLYLIFLRSNLEASFSQIPDSRMVLNFWVIASTLTIAGMTTTLSNLSQMTRDLEQGVRNDLLMAPLGYWKLQLSYLLSAILVGILMQVLVLIIMLAYFIIADSMVMRWEILPQLLLIIFLSASLSSILNMIIISFVKTSSSLGSIETIIGTASGFLIGAYMPIGIMPNFTQTLMKATPQLYIASLFRQVLMNEELERIIFFARDRVIEIMGVKIKWGELLTLQTTYSIVGVMIVVAAIILGCVLWVQKKKR